MQKTWRVKKLQMPLRVYSDTQSQQMIQSLSVLHSLYTKEIEEIMFTAPKPSPPLIVWRNCHSSIVHKLWNGWLADILWVPVGAEMAPVTQWVVKTKPHILLVNSSLITSGRVPAPMGLDAQTDYPV